MSADNWAMCPACVKNPNVNADYTFREDYEIYPDESSGTVKVSYSGWCTRCGSGVDFQFEKPIIMKRGSYAS